MSKLKHAFDAPNQQWFQLFYSFRHSTRGVTIEDIQASLKEKFPSILGSHTASEVEGSIIWVTFYFKHDGCECLTVDGESYKKTSCLAFAIDFDRTRVDNIETFKNKFRNEDLEFAFEKFEKEVKKELKAIVRSAPKPFDLLLQTGIIPPRSE